MRTKATLAILTLALSAGTAHAQNALGDGHALDGNLQIGSGGRNTVTNDFASEVARRNAIVTGNAAGGRSFRGEVGYVGLTDFRAETGEELIFDFNRDSLYSGLATSGIRGIQALQFQYASTTSGLYDPSIAIAARPGSGRSAFQTINSTYSPSAPDMFNDLVGSLRSTSNYEAKLATRPEVLNIYQDERSGVTTVLSASPLIGLQPLRLSNPLLAGPVGQDRTQTTPASPGTPGTPGSPDLGTDIDPQSPTGLRLEALNQARKVDGRTSPHLRLLNQLNALNLRIPPTTANGEIEPSPIEPEDPQATPGEQTNQPTPIERALQDLTKALDPTSPLDLDDPNRQLLLDALRRSNVDVDSLLGPQANPEDTGGGGVDEDGEAAPTGPGIQLQELFREHMSAGEELLAKGQWFLAEERFAAALAVVPGDAMASAGQLWAQIGAGLFRSASLNLRALLRAYPELVSVRFAQSLRPGGEREQTIRERLRTVGARQGEPGASAGLMLAYMGHQTGRRSDIEEGFALIEGALADTTSPAQPDPIYDFLRAVWLEGQTPESDPPAK